jgi:hypothetical protein
MEGRAFYLVSVLHWCLDWLPAVDLQMIDVSNEDVLIAVHALRWEHGIDIEIVDTSRSVSALAHADLYAAAAFRSADHLRLAEAEKAGVPVLLTLQYPDEAWLSAAVLCRREAAFNPREYARELESAAKAWL